MDELEIYDHQGFGNPMGFGERPSLLSWIVPSGAMAAAAAAIALFFLYPGAKPADAPSGPLM